MFVGVAFAMLVVLMANHPDYPPSGTGDQGTLPLIFAAASLGVISFSVGLVSLLGLFTCVADKVDRRCFLEYTALLFDMIFVGIAIFAVVVSKDTPQCVTPHHPPLLNLSLVMARLTSGSLQRTEHNLGDHGMQCYANMGSYQGCMKLLVAMIMIIPGIITAIVSFWLEYRRVKKRNEASWNG